MTFVSAQPDKGPLPVFLRTSEGEFAEKWEGTLCDTLYKTTCMQYSADEHILMAKKAQ